MVFNPSQSILVLSRHSAVRFLIVGGLSIAADAAALVLLHGVLGVWLPAATALAYAAAFVVNFGLNRVWAFRATGGLGSQLGRYVALVAVNLSVTVVLVPALTWLGLPYLLSKLVTAAGLAVVNYLVSKRFIFIPPPAGLGPPPAGPLGTDR